MKRNAVMRPVPAALFLLLPAFAQADGSAIHQDQLIVAGFVEDTGAADRIEAGDRLRVLSQAVPAAICHLHNGVATDLAVQQLEDGVAEFERLTLALLNGDEALGIIGSEERRRTRVMIEELQLAWQPMEDAARAVLDNPSDAAAATTAYGMATDMMDQSYALMAHVEGQYGNPAEILAADSMLLEIAGRQSMMTQRLALLSCKMWSGAADQTYVDLLGQASYQYEMAFDALSYGAPQLGINPPPTPEIEAALSAISADGALVISKLNSLVSTGQKDPESAADLYRLLSVKTVAMDEIADMYADYSKRIY